MCERWDRFENFLADMGEKPENLTLERKDSNGNYEPSNCRWASSFEQQRNTSRNKFLTAFGKRQVMRDWENEYRMCRKTINKKLAAGKNLEQIISESKFMRPHPHV